MKLVKAAIVCTAFSVCLLLTLPVFASGGHYDLLIIGPEAYRPLMEGFIAWKASMGISARYVSVEQIKEAALSTDLSEGIHAYVEGEYVRSGIRFLLLVGGYGDVPPRYVYSPCEEAGWADFNYKPSDWYYGVPDWSGSEVGMLGGNVPKIAVGRLPVRNGSELERLISKIMAVEADPPEGRLLLVADAPSELCLGSMGAFTVENSSRELLDTLCSVEAAYVATYTHGSPQALYSLDANPRQIFTIKDAERINRTYGIHYLVACFAGALDLADESLARILLVSEGGPILVVANTRTERLDNPMPQLFWSSFLHTGDVAASLMQAVNGYLNDPANFNSKYPIFQKYNLYLCQAVYGDISWKTTPPESPSRSVQDGQPSTVQRMDNNTFQNGKTQVILACIAAASISLCCRKRIMRRLIRHGETPTFVGGA